MWARFVRGGDAVIIIDVIDVGVDVVLCEPYHYGLEANTHTQKQKNKSVLLEM